MKKTVGFISTAMLVLVLHAPAQGLDLRVGATANYGTVNSFGIGPRVELDLGDSVPGLRLAGDYHKFFDTRVYNDIDGLSVESNSWDAGFHVLYDFSKVADAGGATIYGGAGILYADRTYDHRLQLPAEDITTEDLLDRVEKLKQLKEKYQSDSGIGFALTVGSTFDTGWTVIPFVEARYTIGIMDELVLAVGILFSTGPGAE